MFLPTDRTPKILIISLCIEMKGYHFCYLYYILFSLSLDCFTLCCVRCLSFRLSVGTVCRLAPCEVGIQYRPLCCEQGLTGK